MNDTTRPASLHLEELTTNIKGPNRRVQLARITCLHGPNGSGKTAILQSIELLVRGQASDISGRNPKSASDIATLTPGREGELAVIGRFSSGDVLAWGLSISEGKVNGPVVQRPSWWDAAVVDDAYPMEGVRGAVMGSGDTARSYYVRHAAAALSGADIAKRLPPDVVEHYTAVTGVIQGSPLDQLLQATKKAGEEKRRCGREIKASQAVVQRLSEHLPPEPMDADLQAARKRVDDAQEMIRDLEVRLRERPPAAPVSDKEQVQATIEELVVFIDQEHKRIAEAEVLAEKHAEEKHALKDTLPRWEEYQTQWTGARNAAAQSLEEMATIPEPQKPGPWLALTHAADLVQLQLATEGGGDHCLACGAKTSVAALTQQLAAHREAITAWEAWWQTQNRAPGAGDIESAQQKLAEANHHIAHAAKTIEEMVSRITMLELGDSPIDRDDLIEAVNILESQREILGDIEAQPDVAEVDTVGPALEEARKAYAEHHQALSELEKTVGSWEQVRKAEAGATQLDQEQTRWKKLEKGCKAAQGMVMEATFQGFIDKVNRYTPKGWSFTLEPSNMRPAWWKKLDAQGRPVFADPDADAAVCFRAVAAGGAEWATALTAMSIACATEGAPFVLVVPEDRAWDSSTLAGALRGFAKAPKYVQVIVASTVKPKGRMASEIKVIDVTNEKDVCPLPINGAAPTLTDDKVELVEAPKMPSVPSA